jgi:hypothetical protein
VLTPTDELDELFGELQAGRGVDDRGVGVSQKVAGHDCIRREPAAIVVVTTQTAPSVCRGLPPHGAPSSGGENGHGAGEGCFVGVPHRQESKWHISRIPYRTLLLGHSKKAIGLRVGTWIRGGGGGVKSKMTGDRAK